MTKSLIDSRAIRSLSPQVRKYLQASLSDNTRRAYSNDLAHFIKWGGRIPSSPARIASYLTEHANTLSYATLSRRVVAIGRAHTINRFPSPADTEIVKATLHGIRRTTSRAQRRVSPVLLHDVQTMVRDLQGMKGARDRALLLTGFAGAFRRSELVAIRVEDVQFVDEGMVIRLRRGKTDQAGRGRDIAIPFMQGKSCPVKAVIEWIAQSAITGGALFRSVDRYGRVVEHGLSPQSVALIVKQRATAIGLDASQFSGHSLRAGFVTSAAKASASIWKICQQTGHQSEAVMQRYIRDSHLFTDNPFGKMR
ncbi:MAG: site-specific integrase [Gallionella sp.]|nr:site-specific integrase [Gallionella sp.]